MSEEFYIVSVVHTPARDRYITFWRPNNAGYAYPLSWAGKYSRELVAGHLGYYNDGRNNIAIPCAVADGLAIEPIKGVIDNNAGPVVPNTKESWKAVLAAVIAPPAFVPRPTYSRKRRSVSATQGQP